MALSGMVRVGTIKKPAKRVKINMIKKNLMVGNIGLAFNLLNECAWCAGAHPTLGHGTPCPYECLPGPAQEAPRPDEQDQQEDHEGDDVLVGAGKIGGAQAFQ